MKVYIIVEGEVHAPMCQVIDVYETKLFAASRCKADGFRLTKQGDWTEDKWGWREIREYEVLTL